MKTAFLAFAIVGTGWLLWPNGDNGDRDAHRGGSELFDRVWVDHLPRAPKEKVDVLIVLREMGNLGVFQHTSAYEGRYASFEWTSEGAGALAITMLQTEKESSVRYKVSREGCEPFDWCLEVKGAPQGGKRYGSMDEWVIESAGPEAARALVFGKR